jgi:hypothetical protein
MPIGPCTLLGLAGFDGSGMDFSSGGLNGLSTFGYSSTAGTQFTEETKLMTPGILCKRFTCYLVISKEN